METYRMQKKLIALAALASLSGVASAQSTVTLWGIVDATLAHGNGSVSKKTQLTNSGLTSSRLGLRGTEDLGGGMSASFWLEAGVNNDTGTGSATNTNNQASGGALPGLAGGQGLVFNRRSTVSLQGNWGELRVGRDFTPQYRNLSVFDPFENNGIGTGQNDISIITGVTQTRASNSIAYLWNTSASGWGTLRDGVYASAMYYLGENSTGATKKDGTGFGLRVGYAAGPLNIAAAVSKTTYTTAGASGVAGLVGDVHQNNIGASYNFGVATAMAEYSSDKNGPLSAKGYLVGATVPVGAGVVRASYSRYRSDAATHPTAKKLALGYVHNLSKRTAVYATIARVSNEGASASALAGSVTAAGGSSSGYEFGLKHSF
jgi:predicted porin